MVMLTQDRALINYMEDTENDSWYILIPSKMRLMSVLGEKLDGPFTSLVQLWTSQT